MDTRWKLLKSRYVKRTIESKTKRRKRNEEKGTCSGEKKFVGTNREDKAQQVERGINKITKERT